MVINYQVRVKQVSNNNFQRYHRIYFQIKEGSICTENEVHHIDDYFTLNIREMTKIFNKDYFLELIEDCYLINDVDFVIYDLMRPKQEIRREVVDKYFILDSFKNIQMLIQEISSTDKAIKMDLGNALVNLFIEDIWNSVINEIMDILKEVNKGIEDEEKHLDLNLLSVSANNQIKMLVDSVEKIVFHRLKDVNFNQLRSKKIIKVEKKKKYKEKDPVIIGDKVSLMYNPEVYRFLQNLYPEIVGGIKSIMGSKLFEKEVIVQLPNTKIIKEVMIKSNSFTENNNKKNKIIREFFINNILMNFYRDIKLEKVIIVFTEDGKYDLRKNGKDYSVKTVCGCEIKRSGEVNTINSEMLRKMIVAIDSNVEIVYKNFKY